MRREEGMCYEPPEWLQMSFMGRGPGTRPASWMDSKQEYEGVTGWTAP